MAAALIVAALLVRFYLPGPWPWRHGPVGAPAIPGQGRYYLGVNSAHDTLTGYEEALGLSPPAILGGYTKGDDGRVSDVLDFARAVPGSIPLVSWGVDLTNGQVAGGSRDVYLRAQAKAIAAYGKPVFLRLDWEMNGSWYPEWDADAVTPAAYIAAWRHIHAIFQQLGVKNAAFVWCPNVGDLRARSWTAWYPGDVYVDWIGVDAYIDPANVGSYVSGPGGLDALAAFAAQAGKPAMLAEWAPGAPEYSPEQAFDQVFSWADRYPATVKALIYFNFANSKRDDLLVDNPAGAARYRQLVGQHKSKLYP